MTDHILDWTASDQQPPFALCSSITLRPAIVRTLALTERGLDQLETELASADQLSYESVLPRLERCSDAFERLWGLASHLRSVNDGPGIRELYLELQPQVVSLGMRFAQSEALFKALSSLNEQGGLSEAQQRVVDGQLHDAELAGIGLSGDAREQFNHRQQRLAELSSTFSITVLDDSKAWFLLVDDAAQIEGMPGSWRQMTAAAAKQHGHEQATADQGPWRITLDMPCYLPLIKDCRDADLRRQVHRAYIQRASQGERDNGPVIKEILSLRQQQATALGYDHYAACSLSSKMAPDVDTVFALLKDIEQAAVPVQQQEYQDLQGIAGDFGIETIDQADWAFLTERLREQRFGLSDEQLRPYFPYQHVWQQLCNLCTEIFHIDIVADPAPAWHADVQRVAIREQGQTIAYCYVDPYARPGHKREGAWMNSAVGRSSACAPEGQAVRLPTAYLVCNFTPPRDDQPCLLTFREVETLFHELGHVLQHVLTRVDEGMVAGISRVEWDAVELPSQFMENWCYHPPMLQRMAKHYLSGEALPQEMMEQILASAIRQWSIEFASIALRHPRSDATSTRRRRSTYSRPRTRTTL